MKINVHNIPAEGLRVYEEIPPAPLELDTELITFNGPLKIKAEISRITNTVTADLLLESTISTTCSRCLGKFEIPFQKKVRFCYPMDKGVSFIDLDPDIREEIILGYPIKFLCQENCKGLCEKCGHNLSQGPCKCK